MELVAKINIPNLVFAIIDNLNVLFLEMVTLSEWNSVKKHSTGKNDMNY
jgi:hypothetical protein